ncbi:MAG: InlB B-repeat-containing protein [Clostridia bacterium]|nr:InlB B-repeat-containing protein [Clostridia bacterium]
MKRGTYRLQVLAVIMGLVLTMGMMCFSTSSIARAEEVSVEITSFMRREVTKDGQIRCSELMEAVLTGYAGNPYELTYEWTNVSCNADLYIYNSYNMDGIDDSPGEIEKIGKGQNARGRGFAWAAVRSKDARNYKGQIKVTVKDSKGNELASDTYADFMDPDLMQDLDGIAFGMFIGETVNVKDLLGRSAIVHITCGASGVSEGRIASGQNVATLSRWEGDYYVTGKEMGETSATITVKKGFCSFHTNQTETVTTPIYVFKQPQTETTTTTLTLTDLDSRCDYFIGSVQGMPVGNTIVFTGLTPNTEYQVTVRGTYDDDGSVKYAYAYVKDTTKPVYAATVNMYQDDVRTDAADILDAADLYLYDESKPDAGYLPMEKTDTGVYTAGVVNGSYHVYSYDGVSYRRVHDAALQINSANRAVDLRYYSVQYDCDGGSFSQGDDPGKRIYPAGSAVSVVPQEPGRDGYAFIDWQYGGKTYQPGDAVTASIGSAVVLKARWEKSVSVTIHVTIDHRGGDGYDTASDKDKVSVYLLEKRTSDPAMLETSDELHFAMNQVKDENGSAKDYTYAATYIAGEAHDLVHTGVSVYTADDPTYTNKSGSSAFDVRVQKSRYDVEAVTCEQDDDGNWTISIRLKFNPTNFDLEYSVRMDPSVPAELYPEAVVYKVAFWAGEERGWEIITQMEGDHGGDLVTIDPETGEGKGSYPVWRYDGGHLEPYGYRVVLTGFVYDGHIITTPAQTGVAAEYSDGNYTAVMGSVNDGKKYGSSFNGAYFDEEEQKGTLDAVITLEAYDVTFDAMGGTVNGKNAQTVNEQYYIPAFSGYQPLNGQHTFLGWYMDEACTIPAEENELLISDVTLYARWDRILTGHVTVEGTYEQNGVTIKVKDRDRARLVNVLLQEIVGSTPQTIDSRALEVTWSDNTGLTAEYAFIGLSPDKTYRVAFEVVNYTASYRNATTASGVYNDTDYTAVYGNRTNETFVDGWMRFTPEVYDQPLTVDATRIGTAFRPGKVLVEVHYRKTGSGDPMEVISQHTADPFGVPVQMDAATGRPDKTYVQTVWQDVWDGELYDYQVQVTKIDNQLPADLPLSIRYGDVSRWSPVHSQPTASLEAILVPNIYGILYHLDEDSEPVLDENGHTWSFETPITYAPERAGYVFSGWYADKDLTGSPVTKIAAECAADTELYAKWTPRTDLTLTVYYKDAADQAEIRASETLGNMTLGMNLSVNDLVEEIAGYQYVSSEPASLTIGAGNNVLTHYYEKKDVDYTVRYFYDGVEDPSQAVTGQAEYGSSITAYTEKEKDGFTLEKVENLPLVIGPLPEENVVNVYYATDVLHDGDETEAPGDADSETGGDEIPDKYQKKVVFKVVNGTWADGTNADVLAIVTLKQNGVWSTQGEAALDVPVGMTANEGFKNGAWDAEYLNGEGVTSLTVRSSDPNGQTFTYTFQRGIIDFDAMAVYQVVHWLQQTDGTYAEANRDFPLYGYMGAEVTATARNYDHYVLKGDLPRGIVRDPRPQTEGAQPDPLTLNVYYDLDRHTVKYDLNGGNGIPGVSYSEQAYSCGTGEQVKAAPSYQGHVFKGWRDQYGSVHQPGESFVIRQDYVFTAVWEVYNLPQTGDEENLVLWIGLMTGSGLLLMNLFKRKRFRKA